MSKLLIVDDDTMILKLYKKYFEKHFEVTTANSAIEALRIINQNYNPEVILSDHLMPEMNGADFLNKISISHPNSIRILMTAESEPSKIIPCVNIAKAFMFLIKPIKEIDLVQAVNLATKHYKLQVQNEMLIQKLKDQNHKMSKEILQINDNKANAIYDIILNLKVFQGNYFYNHFEGVLKIANYFSSEMNLSESSKMELKRITLYYELMMQTFPARLAYTNPFSLKDQDKDEYIKYFLAFLEKVNRIGPSLSFSQIWEHVDGSGFPNRLKIDKISIESQIFQLSNLYFHLIYELPYDDIKERFLNSTYKYRFDEAVKKMKVAQKYILERMKWFNEELFNYFRFAIKENKVETFLPYRENIVIPNMLHFPEFDYILQELEAYRAKEENALEIFKEGNQNFVIKNINPNQIATGMIINQNLVTAQNVPVIKMGTKVTSTVLDNIHNLVEKKQLKDADEIEVKIPI